MRASKKNRERERDERKGEIRQERETSMSCFSLLFSHSDRPFSHINQYKIGSHQISSDPLIFSSALTGLPPTTVVFLPEI